jgi:hypothetical protein
MANEIKLLDISPIKLVPETLTLDARYHMKHFEDAAYYAQLKKWEEKKFYSQKYQNNDTIYFQLVSNYGPVTAYLVDLDGKQIANATVGVISTTFYSSPKAAYGVSIDLTTVPKGVYRVSVIIGSGLSQYKLISEYLLIDADFPYTLLFEYSCDENEQGAIFQNGEVFSFRVEAGIHTYQPGTNDVVFEDEPANLVRLSATPFDAFKLTIGDGNGVPDWVVKKVNKILACNTILIDGRQFVKTDNAKWEAKGEDNSPLKGWTTDIRPAKNRDGLTISDNIPLDNSVVLISWGETALFGLTGDAYIEKVD